MARVHIVDSSKMRDSRHKWFLFLRSFRRIPHTRAHKSQMPSTIRGCTKTTPDYQGLPSLIALVGSLVSRASYRLYDMRMRWLEPAGTECRKFRQKRVFSLLSALRNLPGLFTALERAQEVSRSEPRLLFVEFGHTFYIVGFQS